MYPRQAIFAAWTPALGARGRAAPDRSGTAVLNAASDPQATDCPYGEMGAEQRCRRLAGGRQTRQPSTDDGSVSATTVVNLKGHRDDPGFPEKLRRAGWLVRPACFQFRLDAYS
jgi:hypothetical protein